MISRRDFLKLAALSTGALALRPLGNVRLPEFPQDERLGRITVGKMDVFARPRTALFGVAMFSLC
jgi:hypothetical protein